MAESPSDGGHRWVVTMPIAVVNGRSWAINPAYSVLQQFVEENTYLGMTPLMYAITGSLVVGVIMPTANVTKVP